MKKFWDELGSAVKPELGDVLMVDRPLPRMNGPDSVHDLQAFIEATAHYVIKARSQNTLDVTDQTFTTVAWAAKEDGEENLPERLLGAAQHEWVKAMDAAGVPAFAAIEWRQVPRIIHHKDTLTNETTIMVMWRVSVFQHWPSIGYSRSQIVAGSPA